MSFQTLSIATERSPLLYRATGGTELPHADSSVSLIISGQAAHWLDLPRFYAESKRILKPQGVLALFGYAFVRVHGPQSEKLNDIIDKVRHRSSACPELLIAG